MLEICNPDDFNSILWVRASGVNRELKIAPVAATFHGKYLFKVD